jgi:hypothetical protein
MQKATVTAAQPTGQWESSYGTLYTFNVTLSDGANGEVNSKSPTLRFNIGDEVEYETPKPGKLKLNKPNPMGGSYSNNTGGAKASYGGGGSKDYSKQHALNAACTFLNGSKATKEQITFLADYFTTWLKGSEAAQVQQTAFNEAPPKVVAPPAPAPAPQNVPAPAPVFEDDGLPF